MTSQESGGSLRPWTIEHTRDIHRDRWVSLRADTCRTAEGALVDPYYVLEYPDWVSLVALDDDDGILLVEQYRHPIARLAFGLPGGAIDAGETPVEAGIRELMEETGFEARDWRAITRLATDPSSLNNWCHILLATGVRQVRAPIATDSERLRTVRLPVAEAIARARAGGIPHAMETAALALGLSEIGRW